MKNEIPVFSFNYTEKLYRNIRLENYLIDSFKYEENYPLGNTRIFLDNLLELDTNKSDFDNSVILYENLEFV